MELLGVRSSHNYSRGLNAPFRHLCVTFRLLWWWGLLLGGLRKAAFWQPGMCAGAFRSQKPLFAGVSLSASVRLHLVHVLPGA